MKILVVEDHAGLAEMTCLLLREVYDHEVWLAATGAAAIEKCLALQPELVLLDIHLPDTDGFEVARRIRAFPDSRMTLLVALSGFEIDCDEVSAAGFDAYFRKPMDFDLLPSVGHRTLHCPDVEPESDDPPLQPGFEAPGAPRRLPAFSPAT